MSDNHHDITKRTGFNMGDTIRNKTDGRIGKLYRFESYEFALIDIGEKSYPIWHLDNMEVVKDASSKDSTPVPAPKKKSGKVPITKMAKKNA